MTNIFIEKSNSKYSQETICEPFSKKSKWSRSLGRKFCTVCFIACQAEVY